MRRHLMVTVFGSLMFFGSTSLIVANVKSVQMKISGYLCGN